MKVVLIAHFLHTQSDCRTLKERLRLDVEEKLRRLEEDRNATDNCSWSESPLASGSPAAGAGKKRKRFQNHQAGGPGAGAIASAGLDGGFLRDQLLLPDRRKKPVSVSGPYVVYMLRDSEILEDWALMKRAIKTSGTLAYC